MRNRAVIALGFLAIGIISYQTLLRAVSKIFWLDEANEIFNTCASSYSFTLKNGAAGQCSVAPLYYLLQKLVVTHLPMSGESIFYSYRIISLLSAMSCLTFLFYAFSKYVGAVWGILAIILMNSQPIFHQYAAENRPYMFWTFLFSATFVLTAFISMKSWAQVSTLQKVLFAVFGMALSFVSGAGFIQFGGFCLLLLVFEGLPHLLKRTNWICYKFLLPLLFVAGLGGAYYSFHGCLQYDGGQWDILKTRNWNLVKDVVSLLWPLQGSVLTVFFNILLLAGIAMPFAGWAKRRALIGPPRFVFSTATGCIIQIVLNVFISFLVARVHYYFIPRIFICLVVLRALLVVCGGWALFHWTGRKLSVFWFKKEFKAFKLSGKPEWIFLSSSFWQWQGLSIKHTCPPRNLLFQQGLAGPDLKKMCVP